MRLVFDEIMPDELAALLAGHHVSHVIDLGWRHVGNGKLLSLCEAEGFDAFITKDANLPNQQNLAAGRLAGVVLRPRTQSLPALLALAPDILRALSTATPGSVTVVS